MKIITSPKEMQAYVKRARTDGKTVGLVPTMGAFHEGHLSLMRRARAENDIVVTSIFVNPTQFGPKEDYNAYPRDLENDSKMAEKIGVDVIFAPSVKDMYPQGYATFVNVERITEKMCGASRPGHFRGVATVVTKLFNIIPAHKAYFGQKDAQQCVVIKRMSEDLNFDIDIVILPTVRENDGLAMSSRNKYLSDEERRSALVLFKSLSMAKELIRSGELNSEKIRQKMLDIINAEPLARVDYISIVDAETLEDLNEIKDNTLIALAVFIGKTRLIDNIIIDQINPLK
ncbi:TPA: pantoate--beta-alanine ligase [Candidatus Poribacteria bacterium]|nr:pantoate--beta-alanine ligase [Candidatus Poribacteria bacterium]